MNRQQIIKHYPDLLFADGFDDAIIGVSRTFNKISIAYDTIRCLHILMTREGMSEIDALEHFEYNIVGAYVGDYTPTFVYPEF
tara:strand:- start:225 stop:473 length:249 start_codon:yes stop_codon:yes gene_type:complete